MLKIWSMVRRLARARRVGPCAISNAAPYRKRSSRRLRMPRVLQAGRRRRSQLRSCGCRKVCRFACLLHPPCLRPCPALRSLMSSSLSLDLSELSLGSTMRMEFPDPDDILNFTLIIEPDEGMYRGGRFTFEFKINPNFPHEPPKVECKQKIYHPNIDLQGKVCLNILREDWKPVLNLNAVIVGLQVGISLDRSACHKTRQLTVDHAVSVPGAERVRPSQQGCGGGPATQ